jgi:hypothetical protein
MSCDWHIYCRTCDKSHDFLDANHRQDVMHVLIDHAAAIAALVPLFKDNRSWDVELKVYYGSIDPSFFEEHLGHDLVPRSEYGNYSERVPR